MQTPSTIPTETAATASPSGCEREHARLDEPGQRVVERDVGAADRRGPRSAVRLEHVAVDGDLELAKGDHVAHRAQRASDQTLDLLGPPRLATLGRFAGHPLAGRTGEERVLRGDPSLSPAAHPRRYPVLHRRRAEHLGASHRHEHRPGSEHGEVAGELRSVAVRRSPGRPHGRGFVRPAPDWSQGELRADRRRARTAPPNAARRLRRRRPLRRPSASDE